MNKKDAFIITLLKIYILKYYRESLYHVIFIFIIRYY